ncbi:MAG: enoyl-CoA hydratase [Gammaproteobacteria bacterium]|jgi:enoyl-CoA hydratase/carnithine racemase|nr:enoyl-CoA hydratase [Gammaproteobacteria bacterium]MBP74722.1 enoyl-CoA hydratase [Gammaproteobacteria bacterium]HBX01516.1 crotonase/enoyl-CoA hydratase family protein [Gammaproteobacteria bacterium]|tara:strand:- start:25305 stop:26135 length:831 start_codon:yes stop_codon:yes gene_type:complete
MSSDLVTIDIQNGIADVRLNREEKYNALSQDMFDAIIEAGQALASADDVSAVVLSGNGRGFCAGLDMASFASMSDGPRKPKSDTDSLLAKDERPENRAQRPAMVWKQLPMPVISSLHGVVFGGGCQIALGTDIRIAAPDIKMSIMEIKWGLVPDMSITQTLRDIMPMDVAKELTFTGRILNGEQAKEVGLVTRVANDPLAAAMELAEEIAGKNPDAVRAGKALYEQAWHADARTGLELEAALQAQLIGTANQIEAVKANFEKRAPAFQPATRTEQG